jgi:dGTP triphosphohydrolase
MLELSKEEYQVAKFQKKVDDLDYKIENIKKAVPKNEITGKDEDKFTITEKEVAVRKIWNVSNTAGAFKSFTNKEDAMKTSKEINAKVFGYLK